MATPATMYRYGELGGAIKLVSADFSIFQELLTRRRELGAEPVAIEEGEPETALQELNASAHGGLWQLEDFSRPSKTTQFCRRERTT